ncbi:MAG: SH3 domain-containing protein [Oscillospiraceae bacterium]|nr:SH3 domain-containing protein [Oscillospiraceae bacterium]
MPDRKHPIRILCSAALCAGLLLLCACGSKTVITPQDTTAAVTEPTTEDIYASDNVYIVATVTGPLTLRGAASADGAPVASIPKGERIMVWSVTEDGWGQVTYNGADGYVSMQYLVKAGAPGDPVNEAANATYIVNTSIDPLTMRSGPSSSDPKVASIPKGTEITISEMTADGWGKTVWNGVEGYVSMQFLALPGGITLPPETTVAVDGKVDVALLTKLFAMTLADFEAEEGGVQASPVFAGNMYGDYTQFSFKKYPGLLFEFDYMDPELAPFWGKGSGIDLSSYDRKKDKLDAIKAETTEWLFGRPSTTVGEAQTLLEAAGFQVEKTLFTGTEWNTGFGDFGTRILTAAGQGFAVSLEAKLTSAAYLKNGAAAYTCPISRLTITGANTPDGYGAVNN